MFVFRFVCSFVSASFPLPEIETISFFGRFSSAPLRRSRRSFAVSLSPDASGETEVKEEVKAEEKTEEKPEKDPMEELNELVGLDKLKKDVE